MDNDLQLVDFNDYLNLKKAACVLDVHPQTVRRLIKRGKLPAILFAGKHLIERRELEMFKVGYDPRTGRKTIRRLL